MLQVKIATTPEELHEVFAFRYTIYIEELGKTFLQHNEDKKLLQDEFDEDAFHICVYHQAELVGSLRLRYPSVQDAELNHLSIPLALQKKYRLSVLSRMMIKRKYRHSAAILSLMHFTCDKNIRDGIDFGIIEVENYLVPLYKKFGFHVIGQHLNPYQLERTILFINGRDYIHFNSIGSGGAQIFEVMVNDMNQEMIELTINHLNKEKLSHELLTE